MSSVRKPFFPNIDNNFGQNKSAFERDFSPNAYEQYAIDHKRGNQKGHKEINLNDTKTQKLLRFTELAAGVVSERARLPLEPDQQTLEYKLYQQEDENEIETNSDELNVLTKNQLISKFLEQKIKSLYPSRDASMVEKGSVIIKDMHKRTLTPLQLQKDFSSIV